MYTKESLLIIDDEIEILNTLKRVFHDDYEIHITESPKEAFNIMKEFNIGVILCDQRIPEMKGTDFFKEVKELYPNTIRILITGYTGLSDVIASINEGDIFRFLTKPWNNLDLKSSVREAFKKNALVRENLAMVETLKNTNIVLKDKVRERTQQLEEQKKELEIIIENIADGIFTFDNKGKYKLINKSAKEMFFASCDHIHKLCDGYKKVELYDVNGEKIEPDNIPARRVLRGEEFKNMRMVAKFPNKTSHIDVSGTPICDSEGKFTLGVICSRDMTDYYMHEEAIRNRYDLLNRMIDTFNLPFVRLSCPDLKIKSINKKAFSILKLFKSNIERSEQIKDNKVEDLFKTFKMSNYYQCINEVLKEKRTKYLNKQHYIVNGNEMYWNVIFEPMIEVNGEVQELIVLIIDVTTEIKSNLTMEKSLKLQGEFVVNISHELKTPLNVIFATIQLFYMYCNNGSMDDNKTSIIKYLDSLKQNSYKLSKLINNIVDSSKIEAGFFELKLSNNNIVEVVEEIVTSVTNFTDSKGLKIIFDTDIEEKIIACDPDKMERIVLNLISNAIKFSNDGDEIFVDVKDKNEFVEISVKDNGIGIKAKYLDMIFNRFKQVQESLAKNPGGTGIGLSLVKSIVELHGGSINVVSEFGKGSKFTVILPSGKVIHENKLSNNEVKSENQNILVELSDIYS